MKKYVIAAILLPAILACEALAPPEPEEYQLLDGPVDDLTQAEARQFCCR